MRVCAASKKYVTGSQSHLNFQTHCTTAFANMSDIITSDDSATSLRQLHSARKDAITVCCRFEGAALIIALVDVLRNNVGDEARTGHERMT